MDLEARQTCEALWGDDWIAPLADILGVNRRTVERWKSGDVPMPRHIANDLLKLPRIGTATSAYGDLLRRLARGESLDDLNQWVTDQRRALGRVRADVGRFRAIAVLADGRTRNGE